MELPIHLAISDNHSYYCFKFAEYDDYSELHGPCADYQPGEDDLQAFDFIRQFRLDMLEQSYPGVKRVRGSNDMQTAYRLKADANLQLATRSDFIIGLHVFWPLSSYLWFKITKFL